MSRILVMPRPEELSPHGQLGEGRLEMGQLEDGPLELRQQVEMLDTGKRMNTKKSKKSVDPLDELYFGRPKREHVKEFAYVFAIIASIVGAYQGFKYGTVQLPLILLVVALVLVLLGLFAQRLLFPLWRGWMAFAEALGTVMTFVVMSITWTVIAIPLAVTLRIIGKKVMDCSFDRTKESYWDEREDKLHDFKLLERQF